MDPLDRGERSASHSGRFTLRERTPGAHWVKGRVGLRAGLDAVEKRNVFCLCQESNPSPSAFHPIAHQYTD
jgi:hypothetical protein